MVYFVIPNKASQIKKYQQDEEQPSILTVQSPTSRGRSVPQVEIHDTLSTSALVSFVAKLVGKRLHVLRNAWVEKDGHCLCRNLVVVMESLPSGEEPCRQRWRGLSEVKSSVAPTTNLISSAGFGAWFHLRWATRSDVHKLILSSSIRRAVLQWFDEEERRIEVSPRRPWWSVDGAVRRVKEWINRSSNYFHVTSSAVADDCSILLHQDRCGRSEFLLRVIPQESNKEASHFPHSTSPSSRKSMGQDALKRREVNGGEHPLYNTHYVFKSGPEVRVEWCVLKCLSRKYQRNIPVPIALFVEDQHDTKFSRDRRTRHDRSPGVGFLANLHCDMKSRNENFDGGDQKPTSFYTGGSSKNKEGGRAGREEQRAESYMRVRAPYSILDSNKLSDWKLFLHTLATLQIECSRHVDQLRAVGCRDLSALRFDQSLYHTMFAQRYTHPSYSNFHYQALTEDELNQLHRWTLAVPSLFDIIRRTGLPPTIVHGSLQAEDIMLSPDPEDRTECIINDWSNIVISHPFFALYRVFEALRPVKLWSPASSSSGAPCSFFSSPNIPSTSSACDVSHTFIPLDFSRFYQPLIDAYLHPWQDYLRQHRRQAVVSPSKAVLERGRMLEAIEAIIGGTGLFHDILLMQQREEMLEPLAFSCDTEPTNGHGIDAINESLHVLSALNPPVVPPLPVLLRHASRNVVVTHRGGQGMDRNIRKMRHPQQKQEHRSPRGRGVHRELAVNRTRISRHRDAIERLSIESVLAIQRRLLSKSYTLGGCNIDRLFASADHDHGGTMDVSEFTALLRKCGVSRKIADADSIRTLFVCLGGDHSHGEMTVEDLAVFLDVRGETAMRRFIRDDLFS